MWQRISRSTSCRSNFPRFLADSSSSSSSNSDPSTKRKQLLQHYTSSTRLQDQQCDKKKPSLYWVVNRPIDSSSLQHRSLHQPHSPPLLRNPRDISSEVIEQHSGKSPPLLGQAKKIVDPVVVVVEPVFANLEPFLAPSWMGVSDKVVSRSISTKLSRTRSEGNLSICSANHLPQFHSLVVSNHADGSLRWEKKRPPYWESEDWNKIIERIYVTGTNNDILGHLHGSEYFASIRPNPLPQPAVPADDHFDDAHLSAVTTSTSSFGYEEDELLPLSGKRTDKLESAPCNCELPAANTDAMLRQADPNVLLSNVHSLNSKLKQLAFNYETSAYVGPISASRHASIVGWMGRVIESMKWPLSAYFTAIHALDYTLWKNFSLDTTTKVSNNENKTTKQLDYTVPLLSTACVLIGVSGECEHRQLTKARNFIGQVPNVTSVRDIICKELSVVAGLSHGSLIHKTAPDFCLYYVSRLSFFDESLSRMVGTFPSLYKMLGQNYFIFNERRPPCMMKPWTKHSSRSRDPACSSLLAYLLTPRNPTKKNAGTSTPLPSENNLLYTMMEVSLVVSTALTMNSLHSHIPCSRLIATVMFHILTLVAPGLACARVCTDFCKTAFLLDYGSDMKILIPTVFLMYEYCLKLFADEESSSEGSSTSRYEGFDNKCTGSAFMLLNSLSSGKLDHQFPTAG